MQIKISSVVPCLFVLFFLGNENMYWLTRYNSESLKIDMEDFDGNKVTVLYKFFAVGSSEDMYRLRAEDFEGDAGIDPSKSMSHIFALDIFDSTWSFLSH